MDRNRSGVERIYREERRIRKSTRRRSKRRERPPTGYRLALAEITYRLPDYPSLLQTFIWQHYDMAPEFPVLRRFLAFWEKNLDGELHSVRIDRNDLAGGAGFRHAAGEFRLH